MDMISQLPEPIIHDILSFLPNKDSTRTCVLSKAWRHFQATKPFMVFNHLEFDPQVHGIIKNRMIREILFPKTSLKKGLFMDYVENSLKSFLHQKQQPPPRLRQFDLTFCTYDSDHESEFGRVDQWLHDVIHNGIHTLCLHMISKIDKPCYPLPHYALSSHMLHELCLSGSVLIDPCIDITLHALRSLTLCDIHNVNDDSVKHLFSGCPFVEVLRIKGCGNLVNLQASSLVRLVEVSLDSCRSISMVEVGSTSFQSFSYSHVSGSYVSGIITLLGAFKTLRKLKLEACGVRPHSSFHEISTFIQLEELVLECVDFVDFTNIKISSQSLKRLVIRSLVSMKEVVEIECPNLQSMEYASNVLPFHSLGPLNPKHLRVEFYLLAFQHLVWLDAMVALFENGFGTAKYPKAFIVLKDHKEVIIMDLDGDGVLISAMLSFLQKFEDLESTSRIIIASTLGNLSNEILIPMPPNKAFNIVSSCTSSFTQIISEKLSRLIESCGCIVEKDTTTENVPNVLRQCLSSSCQITRIVSKWDWII